MGEKSKLNWQEPVSHGEQGDARTRIVLGIAIPPPDAIVAQVMLGNKQRSETTLACLAAPRKEILSLDAQ